MDNYEKRVAWCRKNESSELLKNFSTSHAVTLFKDLLGIAADKGELVTIYSGRLDREFYTQLTKTVENTLKKSKVLVAVAKEKGENEVRSNPFAEIVVNSDNGVLKEGVEKAVGADFPHFILVGDRRYRLEKDDKTREAIACFNDPILGGALVKMRDKLEVALNS